MILEASREPPFAISNHHQKVEIFMFCQNGAKHSPSSLLQGGPFGRFWGGPLAALFFRLQPDVFSIQKASRNKSFRVAKVSNYEEFDSVNDFSPGPRDLSG